MMIHHEGYGIAQFDLRAEAIGSSRRARQNNYFIYLLYPAGKLGDFRDLSLQHLGE